MKTIHQEMFEEFIKAEPQPVSPDMRQAIWRDVAVAAVVAKRRQRRRDALWGSALAVLALGTLSVVTFYVPTKTVTVTEIVQKPAPNAGCQDALDQAGVLFGLVSQVMKTYEERDTAEAQAVDALRQVDKAALDAASATFFEKNEHMEALLGQASKVDIASYVEACHG